MNHQQIPKDDNLLQTAFCIYQPSCQTTTLESEQNRTVFAENFESRTAHPLSTCCLMALAHNYKNHPMVLVQINAIQLKTFYDFIDENLQIDECINIEADSYWKRVYSLKCTDKMLLKERNQQKDVNWKNLSITLKYIDLIENTPYERWNSIEMEEISRIASPYITELKISKLQASCDASFEEEPGVSTTTITDAENKSFDSNTSGLRSDYSCEVCHHVDLSILGNLFNLNSLNVEFVPPELKNNYHNRYFNFSYEDMQNLARGILDLKNLRSFKLRKSRMDCVKFCTILGALQSIFVENLEFFFCQLEDDCGEALYEYLISTKSLKCLDLSGNFFKGQAIEYLSQGIKNSSSKLTYLALSHNPICDESVCGLTKTLESYEHMEILNLSGIHSHDIGASGIIKLVEKNSHLVELHMIAVPMNGAGLIDAMKNNYVIQKIICQGCGLTLEEEFKVEILLQRNRFMKSNPYIGDITKTEEEIDVFNSRIKNTIFLKALKDKNVRLECFKNKNLEYVDADCK